MEIPFAGPVLSWMLGFRDSPETGSDEHPNDEHRLAP
jgi:hypothetical protein